MAITPRGATTASTNSGTSIAVVLPSNLEVGDLILVGIGHRVGSSGTITAPAGWTQINSQINSTTVLAAALFRRIAEAGDAGASVTFQSGSGSNTKITAIAQGYGNVDQTNPINGSGAQANASSVNIVAPAITAAAPSLLVMFASVAYGTTINVTSTWTQSGHISTGGGGASSRNTSAQQSKADATVNPPSVTAVANDAAVNIGAQIALKEAAAGNVTVTPTTASLVTAAFAPIVSVSGGGGLTTYAADAYARSVTDGLGTADTGGSYSLSGTAADFDVDGAKAVISVPSSGSNRTGRLLSVDARDIDFTTEIEMGQISGSGEVIRSRLLVRRRNNGDDGYEFRTKVNGDGTVSLEVLERTAAVLTSLGAGFSATSVTTVSAGDVLAIRFQAEGSTSVAVRFKAWNKTTESEPGWDVDNTHATPSANQQLSGAIEAIQIVTLGAWTGSYPFVTKWDNLNVTSIAAGGTVVTPGVANLALTSFAPTATATAHQTVTPGVAAIVVTTFAPTITASNHQSVTPGVAALTTATFAPTVALSDNQLVTPGVTSLTLATFAPTINATAHITATPTTAALVTSTFAPTVTATANVTVTPTTASLTLATFAPTVTGGAGQTVTPSVVALTLTTFVPAVTATAHQTATPDPASLTLAALAPTVTATAHVTVVPGTASLVTATFAPTVSAGGNVSATPDVASLTTTAFAPSVTASDHQSVTPDVASLTTSTFAPTIALSDNQSVTPDTASLTLAAFAPVVTAPATVTPATASLTLATFVPIVEVSDAQAIVPAPASLTLTTFAPTVSVSDTAPVWTTPLDTAQISTTPELLFLIPDLGAPMHFQLHLDTADTFDTGDLRDRRSDQDQTGWDFWNGSDWEVVASTGVPATFAGNEARYTVQTPLTGGTWYRRVRAGV